LEAEILFLRRQLALYRERGVKPRRVDVVTRVTLDGRAEISDGQPSFAIMHGLG
jgi:hypothetical protein